MKQTAKYFGFSVVGQSLLRSSFGVYAQAIWHLGICSLAGCPGLGKKDSGKSLARCEKSEQTTGHMPVMDASKSQAADKPDNMAEDILPVGTLTEIRSISHQSEQCSMEAQSHSLRQNLKQMLPALASFCQQRWLVLVAPPCLPSIDELKKAGIDPARVLLVHSGATDGFDVLEQTLRSGTCGAVLAWLEKGDAQTLDHLRQAAETGNAWGVLFRATKRKRQARHIRVSPGQQGRDAQLKMAIS